MTDPIEDIIDGLESRLAKERSRAAAAEARVGELEGLNIGSLTKDALDALVHDLCGECFYTEHDGESCLTNEEYFLEHAGRTMPCRVKNINSYCSKVFMLMQAIDADEEKPSSQSQLSAERACDNCPELEADVQRLRGERDDLLERLDQTEQELALERPYHDTDTPQPARPKCGCVDGRVPCPMWKPELCSYYECPTGASCPTIPCPDCAPQPARPGDGGDDKEKP